ncbi:hypothetical protein BH18VER2_BH18VER2_14530 [soil metagenome]
MNHMITAEDCRPPANVPKDYCRKLKSGIARLEATIQAQYEAIYPAGRELIARAVREAKEASWTTPFPSLFFPALAHLKVSEVFPSA